MTEQLELPDMRDGIRRAVQRHELLIQRPIVVSGGVVPTDDPTFHHRKKIANFCDTACRLFNDIDNLPKDADLATTRALLETIGKKLRAAVMAATE